MCNSTRRVYESVFRCKASGMTGLELPVIVLDQGDHLLWWADNEENNSTLRSLFKFFKWVSSQGL